jgi:hypothetical protein
MNSVSNLLDGSDNVSAPVTIKIDAHSAAPPSIPVDAVASQDPRHENFWADHFLFVFPIAMSIIFAVFAAVLASGI